VLATGHHRNGYLLAPATASAIEALITDGTLPVLARPFGLDRFGPAAARHHADAPSLRSPIPQPTPPRLRERVRAGGETGMLT
jgi:glycine/D-amino acid oxidase-like deaminating enzyme